MKKLIDCSECGCKFDPASIGYTAPFAEDERGEYHFCCNACWISWIMTTAEVLVREDEEEDEDWAIEHFLDSPETVLFKRFIVKRKDFGKMLDLLRKDIQSSRMRKPLLS